MKVHIWVPDLNQTGGIQAFSKFLIKAAQELFGGEVCVFSKADKSDHMAAKTQNYLQFLLEGVSRNFQKVFFSCCIFFNALIKSPQLIIVTHVHFAVVALILNKILKQKYMVVVHGVEVWDVRSWLLKKSIRCADKVLAVSDFTKQKLIDQKIVNDDVVIIFPNTFDESRFYVGPPEKEIFNKYGIESKSQVLLTVCRLVRSEFKKGYNLVLEAMIELSKEFPDLRYIIIGEGEDHYYLSKKIKDMCLSERVVLAGKISDHDLPNFYRSADLFVMPSEREGFGIVYLEALACGLPVVAARCAGTMDALMNGKLGDMIQPGDMVDLIEKIGKKLKAPSSLAGKVKLSQEVIYYFGYKKFRDRLSLILNQLLNEQ